MAQDEFGLKSRRAQNPPNADFHRFLIFPNVSESMPMQLRTLTQDTFQAPVRVISRDLKNFDCAGSEKFDRAETKFPIALHCCLCFDLIILILSLTRQESWDSRSESDKQRI